VDFHVIVTPSGWEVDDSKGRMKATVHDVKEGHTALIVGKTRSFSIFRKDRKGNVQPAFQIVKDAVGDGKNLELKGYSQAGGEGQYGPITYHTIQKARLFTGELPTSGSSGTSGGSRSGPENAGNGASSNGANSGSRGMNDADRQRIVACWALERAQVQVGVVEETTDVEAFINRWASWYAEQAYRLGAFIGKNEGDWLGIAAAEPPVTDAEPPVQEEPPVEGWDAPAEASGDWGEPQPPSADGDF
jgi:hypothetical protein